MVLGTAYTFNGRLLRNRLGHGKQLECNKILPPFRIPEVLQATAKIKRTLIDMSLEDLAKFGKKLGDLAKPETFVQQVLIDWGNELIIDLRENLETGTPKRYASGNLAGSITPTKPEVNDKGNLQLSIMMAPYWDYINQGVDGLVTKYGSDYAFTSPPHMKTPSGEPTFRQSIIQWIGLKGISQISYMDEGERVTIQMDSPEHINQGATVIMKGVRRKGIAPSYFVDNALTDDAFTDLENSIFEAIQKDLLT